MAKFWFNCRSDLTNNYNKVMFAIDQLVYNKNIELKWFENLIQIISLTFRGTQNEKYKVYLDY